MKLSQNFLPTVIVLVLIVVATLMCFVPCMMPYSPHDMHSQSKYSAYEGFESEEAPNAEEEEKKNKDAALASSPDGSPDGSPNGSPNGSVPEPDAGANAGADANTDSSSGSNDNAGAESFVARLSPAPVGEDNILDKFSHVTSFGINGKNGCVSSGLSNSKGHLCLTPELIASLKTRGGNAYS